jgi:hypothetical protein
MFIRIGASYIISNGARFVFELSMDALTCRALEANAHVGEEELLHGHDRERQLAVPVQAHGRKSSRFYWLPKKEFFLMEKWSYSALTPTT